MPAHRAAWRGDGRVLVATALRDHDVPVAFDTAGNRYLLSSETPPAIPVLALVPVETDFSLTPSPMMCYYVDCGGGACPRCAGDRRPAGLWWELLEAADHHPLALLVRAIADPRALEAFRR